MAKHSISLIQDQAKQRRLTCGTLLELGPGRVWPGQAWLKQEPDLNLIGLGYGEDERQEAQQQARRDGLAGRVRYPAGDLSRLALDDRSVDGVVTFGALHLWPRPMRVLDEIARVLKIGGKFFCGDARRDLSWLDAAIRSHVGSPALQAVYRSREKSLTAEELKDLLAYSRLQAWSVQIVGPDLWAVSAV